jgi:hypothetical protein
MGGEPVVRGTRVPVRTIVGLIEQGESRKMMREDYPQVPEEAYAVAVLWTHANPRRGRPSRPWDLSRASGAPRRSEPVKLWIDHTDTVFPHRRPPSVPGLVASPT